ncbi:Ganglioside-induced differentiation-associated protein 1-like 1 [Acipenser ruthenus]|uniref:Ganglioside-induced differentiation-associated protein 1-like 1 n=1 Tax=Acipenser ruthenus TaxID=7906 RepID=A0A444V2S3_ACIRT|nr:Ganglioside-induced differentiation-associated protein 1-like 1 [Acipenser ruthenus]
MASSNNVTPTNCSWWPISAIDEDGKTADEEGSQEPAIDCKPISKDMLVLYHWTQSFSSQKVRLVINEKGLVCDERDVSLPLTEHKEPWFMRLNLGEEVPVFIHGDTIVSDYNQIIDYLEKNFVGENVAQLIPESGTPLYARVQQYRELLDGLPMDAYTHGCILHPELTTDSMIPKYATAEIRMGSPGENGFWYQIRMEQKVEAVYNYLQKKDYPNHFTKYQRQNLRRLASSYSLEAEAEAAAMSRVVIKQESAPLSPGPVTTIPPGTAELSLEGPSTSEDTAVRCFTGRTDGSREIQFLSNIEQDEMINRGITDPESPPAYWYKQNPKTPPHSWVNEPNQGQPNPESYRISHRAHPVTEEQRLSTPLVSEIDIREGQQRQLQEIQAVRTELGQL